MTTVSVEWETIFTNFENDKNIHIDMKCRFKFSYYKMVFAKGYVCEVG